MIEAVAKKATKRKPKADIVLPPITVSFEEAVSKLLKISPSAKRSK